MYHSRLISFQLNGRAKRAAASFEPTTYPINNMNLRRLSIATVAPTIMGFELRFVLRNAV